MVIPNEETAIKMSKKFPDKKVWKIFGVENYFSGLGKGKKQLFTCNFILSLMIFDTRIQCYAFLVLRKENEKKMVNFEYGFVFIGVNDIVSST